MKTADSEPSAALDVVHRNNVMGASRNSCMEGAIVRSAHFMDPKYFR